MREFSIPERYKSSVIQSLKYSRQTLDPRKKDLRPSVLRCGKVEFKIARHFGFCFGVQNAIEKAYQAVEENKESRIYLVSEMIHNQFVNDDLKSKGVKFLSKDPNVMAGEIEQLTSDDVVIIPAFGVTVELLTKLQNRGVRLYDTTCPFVQRVWRRGESLGKSGFTVVIHGRRHHEEARATFSHAYQNAPSIVVRDLEEAQYLADFILGKISEEDFYLKFSDVISNGFNPMLHLNKIGVVNQTTMLATETHQISDILREALIQRFGEEHILEHFSDTQDTLCYATTENQDAVKSLLASGGDLALVVGGYNSSNTSHLVELLEQNLPTYYIESADEITAVNRINHFDLKTKELKQTVDWFPASSKPVRILLTAGASCPDIAVDLVIAKVLKLLGEEVNLKEVVEEGLKEFFP